MKAIVASFAVVAAFSAIACSSPIEEESLGTADEALTACSEDDPSLCPAPSPPFSVVGSWGRRTATLRETLDLRPDGTYTLTETVGPVCVRAPCPAFPTVEMHTEGAYAVGGKVIKLRPVRPDPRLPEVFDLVRRLPPIEPLAAADEAVRPLPAVALHAVERGSDIYLTREAQCPSGTTLCMQCGAYPPGGVCTSFVCLPPTRPCLPVP